MTRKLWIIAALVALFSAVTIGPASAIAVEGGPDGEAKSVIVPQFGQGGPDAGPNDAHGPMCGVPDFGTPEGCANHTSPDAAIGNATANPGLNLGVNVGAWNSVFQSSENSAICGIWATTAEAEAGFEELACDYAP